MLELLGTIAKGPIDCTISYNELVLVMRFAYEGRPLVLPAKAPDVDELVDSPDGVMRMGGWIVRKLSDYSTVSLSGGKQQVQMVFEC